MRLMYGTPPSPGRGRDLEAALKRFTDQQQLPFVEDSANPGYSFTWNNIPFNWVAAARFDGVPGDGWDASVWHDGLRWKALIRVAGGRQEGIADSPTEALNEAQRAWVALVAKIGTART